MNAQSACPCLPGFGQHKSQQRRGVGRARAGKRAFYVNLYFCSSHGGLPKNRALPGQPAPLSRFCLPYRWPFACPYLPYWHIDSPGRPAMGVRQGYWRTANVPKLACMQCLKAMPAAPATPPASGPGTVCMYRFCIYGTLTRWPAGQFAPARQSAHPILSFICCLPAVAQQAGCR